MTRTRTALALLAALAVAGTAQAQPAAPKAAAPAAAAPAAAAPAGKALYPQSQFDFMLKERLALTPGSQFRFRPRLAAVHLFDPETERRIDGAEIAG